MPPSSTPFDPCENCDPTEAQEEMAPLLRPTIKCPDAEWSAVAALSYAEKKTLIEEAKSSAFPPSSSAPVIIPGPSGIALQDQRDAANAFATAMLQQFDDYKASGLDLEYYCAAVNYIAFAKWSDLDAFERIEAEDFLGNNDLKILCDEILYAAKGMGTIKEVPDRYILNGDKIEMRALPYTDLLAIFINDKPPRTLPEKIEKVLKLTVAHEVGHYLFWHGELFGTPIEVWARDMIGGLAPTPQAEAYRFLEELFCDAVADIVGGVALFTTLIETIGKSLGSAKGDYWRSRMINTLLVVKNIVDKSEYEPLLETANGYVSTYFGRGAIITSDQVKSWRPPYLDPLHIEDGPAQNYLRELHENTGGIRERIESLSNPERKERSDMPLAPDLTGKSSIAASLSTVVPFAGAAPAVSPPKPTAAELKQKSEDIIQQVKAQWGSAPGIKLFNENEEWFGVLQAKGWSNRPTKTNIGT